jgi:transcription elongation factor GreA
LRPFDLSKPIRYILGVDAGALSRVARFDRCLMCEAGRIFAMDFITAEEKTMLEEKLSELRVHDKALIQRIAEARALGDLRENAEYHASREDKAMNDAKIKELEERLSRAQVADFSALPQDMVFVGAIVRLKDEDRGDDDLYRLVGQATGRFDLDYVEVTTTSPMGVSLMKARVGETIRVDLPRGAKRFTILAIEV